MTTTNDTVTRTLALLHPNVTSQVYSFEHLCRKSGLEILRHRRAQLTCEQAVDFTHLVQGATSIVVTVSDEVLNEAQHLSSGPVDVFILGGQDAVTRANEAVASWNTQLHPKGSKLSIHVSQNESQAQREVQWFFPDTEHVASVKEVQALLDEALYPTLQKGLMQLCKEKPVDPTLWLGNWLLQNNPSQPRVEEPEDA